MADLGGRARSSSSLSSGPSSPASRRPVLQLTPVSSTRTVASLGSPRYSSANGGVPRFKRGHVRTVATPTAVTVQENVETVELASLSEADDVFRRFGVRAVRMLEQRMHDAAANKVVELRGMVGERYRDLLSSADSIVRMRQSSTALVNHLVKVRGNLDISPRAAPLAPQISPTPTLTYPPTLAFSINLLIQLPSIINTHLDSHLFLVAARLQSLASVLYSKLSTFENQSLLATFPIIHAQSPVIHLLAATIVRRATIHLKSSQASPTITAQTLASIIMLESTSIPSSLQSLLAARSNSLETFLNFEPTQIEALLHHLTLAINIVIETVQAAREIFGLHEQDGKGGLLGALLSEIERPTNMDPIFVEATPDSTKLGPILLSLPNYVQLQKYLPLDIVSFTPFLSLTAERNLLPPAVVSREIDAWLGRATEQLVQGVTRWISDLEGGASTLAAVRTAVRGALATAGLLGIELQSQLERSIEQRLVLVYREQLAELVRRVPKCMDELLVALPGSGADMSAGYFLFEEPLSFPSPVLQLQPSRTSSSAPLLSASSGTVKKDPFEVFLGKLFKRIEGRSPLLDRGMEELELGAKMLKRDLECWLEGGEGERNQKVREAYVRSAGETLEGIVAALGDLLRAVGQDVPSALFIGSFALLLVKSKTFTVNLLLSSLVGLEQVETVEAQLVSVWEGQLDKLQKLALGSWQRTTMTSAVKTLEEGLSTQPAPTGTAWDWEGPHETGSAEPLASSITPTQPSSYLIKSLRILISSISQLGPQRISADPSIVSNLLSTYQDRWMVLLQTFKTQIEELENKLERNRLAGQALWDLNFLGRFWVQIEGDKEAWKALQKGMMELTSVELSLVQQSTMHYLQRTQIIYSPLLPNLSSLPTSTVSLSNSVSRFLPLGAPPLGGEFKSTTGVVKTGVRLGLLPTPTPSRPRGGRPSLV